MGGSRKTAECKGKKTGGMLALHLKLRWVIQASAPTSQSTGLHKGKTGLTRHTVKNPCEEPTT